MWVFIKFTFYYVSIFGKTEHLHVYFGPFYAIYTVHASAQC